MFAIFKISMFESVTKSVKDKLYSGCQIKDSYCHSKVPSEDCEQIDRVEVPDTENARQDVWKTRPCKQLNKIRRQILILKVLVFLVVTAIMGTYVY